MSDSFDDSQASGESGETDPSGESGETDPSGDSERTEFERVRERAAAAVADTDAPSVYVGLVGPNVQNEYYFANDVDESELQEMATHQLGMLTRVLAEQSDASIEQVADHAAETAKQLNVR